MEFEIGYEKISFWMWNKEYSDRSGLDLSDKTIIINQSIYIYITLFSDEDIDQ